MANYCFLNCLLVRMDLISTTSEIWQIKISRSSEWRYPLGKQAYSYAVIRESKIIIEKVCCSPNTSTAVIKCCDVGFKIACKAAISLPPFQTIPKKTLGVFSLLLMWVQQKSYYFHKDSLFCHSFDAMYFLQKGKQCIMEIFSHSHWEHTHTHTCTHTLKKKH